MYYVITVKDGIITGQHESLQPITKETFINTVYEGHEIINVQENVNVQYGISVASYTSDWKLKPLSQRVEEGLVEVPEGKIVDGEEFREMTTDEKLAAGIDVIITPEIDSTSEISLLKSQLAAILDRINEIEKKEK